MCVRTKLLDVALYSMAMKGSAPAPIILDAGESGDRLQDTENSENSGNKTPANRVGKVGLFVFFCAVMAWPVLPLLFGVNGLEMLFWMA
ncbi:MAG: hypothetical protein ACKVHH_08290, partial [Candidatus Poseidoniales archaeon]